MISENEQWNIADEEFSHWLNGNKKNSNVELTDILKSTFFAFRKRQVIWIEKFCNNSFDFLLGGKYKSLEDILYKPEIRFRKIRLSETEHRKLQDQKKTKNEKLIEGILSGDQSAFNNLYEHEFPKIVRFILDNSGSLESAKDVFQEALVVLIEKVYRNELDLTCFLGTYLYSICRNIWFEHLRKIKTKVSLIDYYSQNESLIFISSEMAPEIYDNVQTAIESLGDPCKHLLECFYYKNMSWDEIASSLGYSNAASARNQKYKCLERIRNIVNVEVE